MLGTARGELGNRLPYLKDLGTDLLPLALDRTENPARPKANWLRVLTVRR